MGYNTGIYRRINSIEQEFHMTSLNEALGYLTERACQSVGSNPGLLTVHHSTDPGNSSWFERGLGPSLNPSWMSHELGFWCFRSAGH